MSIPQEMMMQAEAIGAGMDAAQQQGMEIMTPQGQYSARALNAVVDVINEIMPMFGEMNPMPQYTEDMTMMPQELMNALMAIMTVAEQAGVPIEMELSAIVSDNDLAKLAALIKRLVKDQTLKDFLTQGETEEVTEEVTMESAPAPEGGMEISDEELFAQRV
tara:strand:- start:4310 stop:4795 length:486 start_codon:yes stop_codon:yes gene_type:complete